MGFPNPELLVWARESIGLTHEAVAKKLRLSIDKVQSWEEGTAKPTLAQLRRLANIYKRPLAVFFLPERPIDFQPLRDFRLPTKTGHLREQSTELKFAIRRATDRREWALELYDTLQMSPPIFGGSLKLTDDVEHAGEVLRKTIRISFNDQTQWRQDYEALRNWRARIEAVGILTFHATDVETTEIRGFSISQTPLPVTVANIKDAPRGRIFTFLHEITHVMLNVGGICDFAINRRNVPGSHVESFCNQVAGAALFPKREFLSTAVVQRHRQKDLAWTDLELQDLSRQFGGSREAALVRLLSLGLTTWDYYMEKREEFYELYQKARKQQKGFVAPHTLAISSAGPTFTRLVMEGLANNKITASDFSDYLDLRIKHLPDVQRDLLHMTEAR